MIDLEYDQCSRCERRVWNHDPSSVGWEDIGGSIVCHDCITPSEWVAFDEVVLETRCGRCGSLIFVETIDGLADIPIVEEDAEVMCASCANPDGRIVEMSEGGDRA